MDDPLDGEPIPPGVTDDAASGPTLSGDAEVNARMSSLVSRLVGEPLTSDEAVQEHFRDDQVDTAMAQVVAEIVDPGQIRDEEVDEAMSAVLDRLVTPVVISSEYLDADDEIRDRLPPVLSPAPIADPPAGLAADDEVHRALAERLGTDPRQVPPQSLPTPTYEAPLPRERPIPRRLAAVDRSPIEPVTPTSQSDQPVIEAGPAAAPTTETQPEAEEITPTAAMANVEPDTAAADRSLAADVADAEPESVADDRSSFDEALLPDDGQLFEPTVFPVAKRVVADPFPILSDPFRKKRRTAPPQNPLSARKEREVELDDREVDEDEREDSGVDHDEVELEDTDLDGDEVELEDTDLDGDEVELEDTDLDGDEVELEDTDLDGDEVEHDEPELDDDEVELGGVDVDDGEAELEDADVDHDHDVAHDESDFGDDEDAEAEEDGDAVATEPEAWPFDERPARWPRYALITVLVILCLAFAALVVIAAFWRNASTNGFVQVLLAAT